MDTKIFVALLLIAGYSLHGMEKHSNEKKFFNHVINTPSQREHYKLGQEAINKIITSNTPTQTTNDAKCHVGTSKLFVINPQNQLISKL